jgi:hypothetical protein
MSVVFPEGVQAEGNVKVAWVPALADPADPVLTELTAGTVVDLSDYIKAGAFEPSAEQATGDDRRLSSTETFQVLGRVTRGLGEIRYVYEPQAAPAAAGNKAYETLKQGTAGYVVVRYGLPSGTAFAATQKVDVYPAECGAQRKLGVPENDEFAKLEVAQTIGVTGPMQEDVAIAAT